MIRSKVTKIVRKNTLVKPAGKRRIQRIQSPDGPNVPVVYPKVKRARKRTVEVRKERRGRRGAPVIGFDWSKVKFTKVEPKWKGETVFLIGGGPSLKDFNFERLKSKRTIAINKAFLHHPTADIVYWTDSRFYTWYKNDIDKFRGEKFTTKPYGNVTKDIKVLKNSGKNGLELDASSVRHGNNSGHAAMNLAYHLGAKRIVLLGFDMQNSNGASHFHDGYPVKQTRDDVYKRSMIPEFHFIGEELKKRNVHVINANPNSALRIFTLMPLEKTLAFS